MATISLCMIVKNEEAILARCLDCLVDLMDEIIIVDTGSTDATKEIAARYTDKIYDFEWINDFSAARNFSFSKATMEYIYAPDADEVLDEENRQAFAFLKEALVPEVEIVQMKYHTITEFDTVLNAEMEYRPKLFKRLRPFTWINPVHETIRLDPVVFDSDIVITHMPQSSHGKRDFSIFEKMLAEDIPFTETLIKMYATELMKVGDAADLAKAQPFIDELLAFPQGDLFNAYALALKAKELRLAGSLDELIKFVASLAEDMISSEVAHEVAKAYQDVGRHEDAISWYDRAIHSCAPILDVHRGGDDSLQEIITCIKLKLSTNLPPEDKCREEERLRVFERELSEWAMPSE